MAANRNPKTQELLRDLVTEYATAKARLSNMGFEIVSTDALVTRTVVVRNPLGQLETVEMS